MESGSTFLGLTTSGTITLSSGSILDTWYDAGGNRYVFVNAPYLLSGSRVQLYNVTDSIEMDNSIAGLSGYSFETIWTTDKTIRLRSAYQNGLSAMNPLETIGTLQNTGTLFINTQINDTIYNSWGYNGSLQTHLSADGTYIEININVGGTHTKKEVAAWWTYYLTTVDGIRRFWNAFTFESANSIRQNVDVIDVKLKNSTPYTTAIFSDNDVRYYRSDYSVPYDISPSFGSIFMDYSGVPLVPTAQVITLSGSSLTQQQVRDAMTLTPSLSASTNSIDEKLANISTNVSNIHTLSSQDILNALSSYGTATISGQNSISGQISSLNNLSISQVSTTLSAYGIATHSDVSSLHNLSILDVESALSAYNVPTKLDITNSQTIVTNSISNLHNLSMLDVHNSLSSDFNTVNFQLSTINTNVLNIAIQGSSTLYSPTGANVIYGTATGNYSALKARDGNLLTVTEDVTNGITAEIYLSSSNITEIPSVLRIYGYYDGGKSHLINIQLWNYVLSAWATDATMSTAAAFFDYVVPLNSTNQNPSTGEMKARFQHNVVSYSANDHLYLDYVAFEKAQQNSSLGSDIAQILVNQNLQMTSDILHQGTAQGGGTGTNQIQLAATASPYSGMYDPSLITITSGTGAGQSAIILEYNGATRTATVNRDWKVQVDNTSVYTISPHASIGEVNEGLIRGGTTNTATLNANASSVSGTYIGQSIFIVSGTGSDQTGLIIAYDGSTKIATIAGNWVTIPDTTSGYVMLPVSPVLLAPTSHTNATFPTNNNLLSASNVVTLSSYGVSTYLDITNSQSAISSQISSLNNLSTSQVSNALSAYNIPTKTDIITSQNIIVNDINNIHSLSASDISNALSSYGVSTHSDVSNSQTVVTNAISNLHNLSTNDVSTTLSAYGVATHSDIVNFPAIIDVGIALSAYGVSTHSDVSNSQNVVTNAISNLNNVSIVEVSTALSSYNIPTRTDITNSQNVITGVINNLNDISVADVEFALSSYNVATKTDITGIPAPADVSAVLSAYGVSTHSDVSNSQTVVTNSISNLNNVSTSDISTTLSAYGVSTHSDVSNSQTVVTNAIYNLNNLSMFEVSTSLSSYNIPTRSDLTSVENSVINTVTSLNNVSILDINNVLVSYDVTTRTDLLNVQNNLSSDIGNLNNLSLSAIESSAIIAKDANIDSLKPNISLIPALV